MDTNGLLLGPLANPDDGLRLSLEARAVFSVDCCKWVCECDLKTTSQYYLANRLAIAFDCKFNIDIQDGQ